MSVTGQERRSGPCLPPSGLPSIADIVPHRREPPVRAKSRPLGSFDHLAGSDPKAGRHIEPSTLAVLGL
jgi:hypothetical protein